MPPPLVLDIDAIDLDRVLLTREQIYEELPHRFEFMQVDALVYMDLELGQALAYRDVREDEFWVRGHLPGRPIFPGVLMIESAAQLASFVAARYKNMEGRFIGLGGVEKAKFRDQVVPNQRLYFLLRLLEAHASNRVQRAGSGQSQSGLRVPVDRHGHVKLTRHFSAWLDRSSSGTAFDGQAFPARRGIFAFTDLNGRVLQLSCGENLRRLITSRLGGASSDQHRGRVDLLAVTRRVWWTITASSFETFLKYHQAAYALFPGQHLKLCRFGPAWFAVIDMDKRFPRWVVSDDPFLGRSACVGPFATRASCARLVSDLEDLFSLCREHAILDQTPHGEPCVYFDMNQCPAPCAGKIQFEEYRHMLDESLAMVTGEVDAVLERLHVRMNAAADALQFEHANRYKEDIARAARIGRCGSLQCRLEDLRYLVVQRGPKRTEATAFLVNQGEVLSRPVVSMKHLDTAAPGWLRDFAALGRPAIVDRRLAMERLWLICHLRRQRRPGPGRIWQASELAEPAAMVEQIHQALAGDQKSNKTQA